MKKIAMFDSTLRDGEQGANINFSISDKINIAKSLIELGIDYIEGGNPYASDKDKAFYSLMKDVDLKSSKLCAFGSTRRKNIEASSDLNLKALLDTNCESIAIFGKSSALHVEKILNTSKQENLNMIFDSVKFLKDNGKEVIFDAEHFFDGYDYDSEYAISSLENAIKGGADYICLCDTNGGFFPSDIERIVKKVKATFQNIKIAIHCHNDNGMAVASSIASVYCGAIMIQGTILGFGERCGNANLSSIIPSLQIKKGYELIPKENLKNLYSVCNNISEIANVNISGSMPYIGNLAFAHKAGMHSDGVLKESKSFEHIEPSLIGNERKILLSEMAGRSAIIEKISKFFPHLQKDSSEMGEILEKLKELTSQGYIFEVAEASFILNVQKILNIYKPCFELINFKCINEQPAIEGKVASAFLKIRVNGQTKISAYDGEGPVHALDMALRTALLDFYPKINNISLTDYKVRVLNSKDATASKVRVLITSSDNHTEWTTIGVSDDIIWASFNALKDSIEYYLLNNSN